MADNKDKKGGADNKTVIKYLLNEGGDKAEFKEFWKQIRLNDYDLDVLEDGKTALMQCVNLNNTEKAWILLEFFADPNVVSKEGKTALHYACEEKRKEFQFMLLLFGANPELEDPEGKKPFDGLEDDRERFLGYVTTYRQTFMFLNRRRRKLLRNIFNKIEANGNPGSKLIEVGAIAKYYTDLYGEQIKEEDAMVDASNFMNETVKNKIDPTEKDTLTFEDFFLSMLKIAHHKGLQTLDQFIGGYKRKHDEEKRELAKEALLSLKNKEQAGES